MPGVLQIEALAQVGAVAILSKPENKGKTAYFGAINNAKFKTKVVPGDVLTLELEIIRKRTDWSRKSGCQKSGGQDYSLSRTDICNRIGVWKNVS